MHAAASGVDRAATDRRRGSDNSIRSWEVAAVPYRSEDPRSHQYRGANGDELKPLIRSNGILMDRLLEHIPCGKRAAKRYQNVEAAGLVPKGESRDQCCRRNAACPESGPST